MARNFVSRRSLLKCSAGVAGANLLRVAFPSSALALPNEEVLPWLDQIPAAPPPDDTDNLQPWENLDTWITPAERFFNVNHYGQPTNLDESSWRLDIGGRVARPYSLTVSDIKALPQQAVHFTIECSGNGGFDWVISAVGNARWGGTPLAPILRRAGILDDAMDVVFYGVDSGPITIRDNVGILGQGRTGTTTPDGEGGLDLSITEQFARSLSVEVALEPVNLLVHEMNGGPLPPEHGFPLRLIVPGWFGIANVKWLTRIEVINRRYAGRLMARDYVSIREQEHDGQTVWTFTTVGPTMLKSAPGAGGGSQWPVCRPRGRLGSTD